MNKHFPEVQREFMDACKQPRFALSAVIDCYKEGYAKNALIDQQIKLWKGLIEEEMFRELFEHLNTLRSGTCTSETEVNALLTMITDDIVDSIYVLCGLANALSLPITPAFEAVHQANLNKRVMDTNGDWTVQKRVDGKILKPEGWKPANIAAIVNQQLEYETIHKQPFTHFLLQARSSLKDHEIGLLVDQGKYEQVESLLSTAIKNLTYTVVALRKQAVQNAKKGMDMYEPEGTRKTD